jgi:hypothetical protein
MTLPNSKPRQPKWRLSLSSWLKAVRHGSPSLPHYEKSCETRREHYVVAVHLRAANRNGAAERFGHERKDPRQSARLMVTRRDCSVVRGGGSWSVDGIVNVIESVEAAREPRARAPNSMTALCGHEVDWRGQ